MFRLLICCLMLLASSPAVRAADQAPIGIGVSNWTSITVTAHILKVIIERNFHAKAVLVPGDNDSIYTSMATGGGIDIHPETWLPNHQSYIDRWAGKDGPIIVSKTHYDAIQGICVNKAATNAGLTSIYDLADPDKAKLLDHDGDGRGEIWIGADGWLSTLIERVRAKTYGYAKTLDLRVMDETKALAELATAVRKGQPFAFYCYGPHYVFQLYDLTLLDEPAHDPSRWKMVTPDQDPDWLNKSSIDVAWPRTMVHISYTRILQNRRPDIAKFLENITLNSRLVSNWTYAIEVKGEDPDTYARQWVKNHADLIKTWLSTSH